LLHLERPTRRTFPARKEVKAMKLVPWRTELSPLRGQMDRLFRDFFENGHVATREEEFAPVLDVAETPEAIVVTAEVPGIEVKDIEISLMGGTLYLKGRKTEEREEKGKTWHRVERSYGAFTRAITLPSAVNAERIEAKSKDGVLTITLPKKEEAKPKQIQIKT
jgi:HSP20 family protein